MTKRNAKRPQKRKKVSKGLILFEMLLLLVILLLVFKGPSILKYGKQLLKLDKLEITAGAIIPYTGRNTLGNSSVFNAKDNIVISEESAIKIYDKTGVLQHSGELNAENTILHSGDTFYVLAESLRGDLVIVDYKGALGPSIKNIGPLHSVEIFQDSTILVVLEDKQSIQLYDKALNLLMTSTINGGTILEANVFTLGSTVAVAAIETDGNMLGTTIYQYDFDGKLLGISKLESEIVYRLFSDDKLRALTDVALYTFTDDGVVIQKDKYQGLLHSYSPTKTGLLLQTEAVVQDVIEDQQIYNFQNYEWETYTLSITPLQKNYKVMVAGNKYLVGLSEDTVDIYSSDFQLLLQMDNTKVYSKCFWIEDNSLVLISDTSADLYTIQ